MVMIVSDTKHSNGWLVHEKRDSNALAIEFSLSCTFVVVNFDALAQAIDFRIRRRQVDYSNQGLWNRISG